MIRVTGFTIKNLMIADGGSAVVDHGLISLCRLDFQHLAICAWWLDHKQSSIHMRTSLHCTRAQSLDISNIREEPSLRDDLSFPREDGAPIHASSPRCEERSGVAQPLLDLECKFEICLELSYRDPAVRGS